jgi:hypothetical protein
MEGVGMGIMRVAEEDMGVVEEATEVRVVKVEEDMGVVEVVLEVMVVKEEVVVDMVEIEVLCRNSTTNIFLSNILA